jgi:hypothetical protein
MDEQEIRERVEKRIKERNEFYGHLIVYAVVISMLWLIWAFSGNDGDSSFPWPIVPMLGWGIGLGAHGLSVFYNSPSRLAARERHIQREIERERERMEAAGIQVGKRKRDALYRLSDDGELIEVMDDEIELKQKRLE